MLLLELMSGTGSIGRAFQELGWQVVSLDLDPKAKPTIVADVCEWEPPEGFHVDVVWASPPCTEFSLALTTRPRDLEAGLRVARRCLELIELLKPKVWFMENPGTGHLPKQAGFAELPCKLCTYCAYGYPYRKLTWVATNSSWTPRPVCKKGSRCACFEDGRHPNVAQRGKTRCKEGLRGKNCSLKQLYSMPPELCREIASAATADVSVSFTE
jgi:hypothetical protein